jgi:hypothetical protein
MAAELVLAAVPQQTRSGKREYVATPFQICKGINAILAGYEFKPIPPQMLYRYASAGRFLTTRVPDGRMQVDRESFEAWFMAYLQKKIRNSSK